MDEHSCFIDFFSFPSLPSSPMFSFLPVFLEILKPKLCPYGDASDTLTLKLEDNFGVSLGGCQTSQTFWKLPGLPRISPHFPGSSPATSPELLSLGSLRAIRRFPGSFPDFPRLPGSSPNHPGSAPVSGKLDTLWWLTKSYSEKHPQNTLRVNSEIPVPAKSKRGREEGDGTENVINCRDVCRKLSWHFMTTYDDLWRFMSME